MPHRFGRSLMFGIPRDRLLMLLRRRVVPNTLAALALVTFAMTPLSWLGVIITLLALAATLSTHGLNGLGRNVAPHAVLAAAVLMGYERSTRGAASVPIGLIVLAIVFLAIVTNEIVLGRVSPRTIRTAHLPGAAGRRIVDPRIAFAAELAAIGAIAVLAAAGSPALRIRSAAAAAGHDTRPRCSARLSTTATAATASRW